VAEASATWPGQTNSRPTETVAPPGFCNRGEVRYGSIGGLEYEVPQSRLYCLCINVALRSMALQCFCRVIQRSSMTMKAHTYYIIFGRPSIGEEASPLPQSWWRHCTETTSGANHDCEGKPTPALTCCKHLAIITDSLECVPTHSRHASLHAGMAICKKIT